MARAGDNQREGMPRAECGLNESGVRADGSGADAIRDHRDSPPTLAEDLPVPRTRPNKASDAVLALFGHVSNSASALSPLPKTTLVVRLTLDDLPFRLGEARLNGIDQPISAGTARRMAAEAGIIPIVMGGRAERSARSGTGTTPVQREASPGHRGDVFRLRGMWPTGCVG